MPAETDRSQPDLAQNALKTINDYVKSQTKDYNLEEYEEVKVNMAITQICGLADIHRATWYDNGVAWKIHQKYDSIEYKQGNGIVIDAKKFLEEHED